MRSHTLERLIHYLGDVDRWPYVWDDVELSKYVMGDIYFSLLAAIRDGCDTVIVTPYGVMLQKEGIPQNAGHDFPEKTPELFTAVDLMLQRDKSVSQLVDVLWTKEDEEGRYEVGLNVASERYIEKIEADIKAAKTRTEQAGSPHIDGDVGQQSAN